MLQTVCFNLAGLLVCRITAGNIRRPVQDPESLVLSRRAGPSCLLVLGPYGGSRV